MKEVNRCPNCGAKLPEDKNGIIKCEYCDSEFTDSERQSIVLKNTFSKYLKYLNEHYEPQSIAESRERYITELKTIREELRQ